jgi:type II secretory pathway pseudopilin PulG
MKRWRLKRSRGYSLVDVLIGIAILGIALSSAFTLSITTSRVTSQTRNLSAATALAEFKLEELRNTDYVSIVSGADASAMDALGDAGGAYTRSWVVGENTPATGLKTVAVTVSWPQWGETRAYTLTGVIGP